jgi:hypothetical protein
MIIYTKPLVNTDPPVLLLTKGNFENIWYVKKSSFNEGKFLGRNAFLTPYLAVLRSVALEAFTPIPQCFARNSGDRTLCHFSAKNQR